MATNNFRDLIVWQKAHSLVLKVYKMTDKFPKSEMFGLTSQLRRACVSIAANIVEGYKKKGKADKLRYFNISQGSLEETRYYFILAKDLNYTIEESCMNDLEEVSKILNSYCNSIIQSK
jgi:four helix bundle protein